MPKDSTIYDIYAGAGKAEGEYEAEWTGIESIWGDIDWSGKKSEERTEQLEATTDSLQAMLETGSTVYEGHISAKEFREVKLPAMQKLAARESFKGHTISEKTLASMGEIDPKKQTLFQQYVTTTEGKEWYGGFAPKEVGMAGKSWEDLSGFEKLMQKKMYRFGEGEGAYTLSRTDISAATGFEKYGGKPDLGQYQKSLFEEAGGVDVDPSEVSTVVEDVVEEKQENIIGLSRENPFMAEGMSGAFQLAKSMGYKAEGQTLYSQWGDDPVQEWAYKFAE